MFEDHRGMNNRRLLAFAMAISLAVASLWLPWLHSGARSRNAFELLESADELELGPALLRSIWIWLLPLVPLLGAISFTAAVLNRNRITIGLTTGLVVVIAGFVFVSRIGTSASAYGSAVAAIACCAVAAVITRPG